MPRLCIGLPVYNGDAYLAPALESLLAQTYTDFRLILSDNASTDGTEAICRAYAARDARIDYRRGAVNRGLAWNFNHVVALADGELFKWAAHDDAYAPRFVERCVAVLDARPDVLLAYTTAQMIDERGAVLGAYREPADATAERPSARFADMLWHWGACTMLFGVTRLAVLRHTQLHGAYPASDLPLLAELALRGRLYEIDEPLLLWRDHAQRPSRRCTTYEELAAWYAPDTAGRRRLHHFVLLTNYLRTMARVPLPAGERLRCAGALLRWLVAHVPRMGNEVRGRISRTLRAAARRAPTAPPMAQPPGH